MNVRSNIRIPLLYIFFPELIEQRAKTKVTKEKAELTLTIAAIYSEQGNLSNTDHNYY